MTIHMVLLSSLLNSGKEVMGFRPEHDTRKSTILTVSETAVVDEKDSGK